MKKKKAIFLDRDGVINKLIMTNGKGRAPYTLEDFDLFPGVEEACQKIKDSDFLTIVVTNQPDVARGWVERESVELINIKVRELLPIDDIKICFHTNNDNCLCRKPAPGMLLEAALEWDIDLKQSFMIGDRYGDIAAGVSAGCRTVLVGPGDVQGSSPSPDYKVSSLFEGVLIILSLN
ncbi:MAG: HAD family hydrolase [Bacteriovorax sp.]|nr:HAD family hydrolase [Bacteriovorax sp.]